MRKDPKHELTRQMQRGSTPKHRVPMIPEFTDVEISHSRNFAIESFLILGLGTDFDSSHGSQADRCLVSAGPGLPLPPSMIR